MANTFWLIIDTGPHQRFVEGQPTSQAAWELPIPGGSSAGAEAQAFAADQNFSVGTVATLIDLSQTPIAISKYKLTSSWQPA